jgi:glycosyltransferase involved in cell wall biosynthesis
VPLIEAIAVDLFVLGIFAVQHSVMARKGFKRWWTRIVPPAIERSTYVLAATAALALVLWQWRPIAEPVLWRIENPVAVNAIWAMFWLGWAVLLLATFLINHFELFGLRQVFSLLLGREIPEAEFRTPFIYSSHNIEYRTNIGKARTDPRRWPLALYMYAAEKMAVKQARCVVAITPSDADDYARWISRDKMLVIPQGFDEREFNPRYEPSRNARKTILFCGNFRIPMNRDVVYTVRDHILEPVLAKYPDALFRFVGAWPPSDVQHPNMEFTGFLEDYPGALKRADVVISPILLGYGFPTKIVEALACGKPTVTTPVGGRALEKDYHILRFAEIPDFANEICNALAEGQPVTDVDHDKVRTRYAWSALVGRLSDWIERDARPRPVGSPPRGAPAHASRT